MPRLTRRLHGFTMIELMVTLAIIATLLAIAAPRYFTGVDKAKDDVLRENLYSLRDAIDKFYADNGHYPNQLSDLVDKHYLRQLPIDPITDSSNSWVSVPSPNSAQGGVYDVKSSAAGQASDGTSYQNW